MEKRVSLSQLKIRTKLGQLRSKVTKFDFIFSSSLVLLLLFLLLTDLIYTFNRYTHYNEIPGSLFQNKFPSIIWTILFCLFFASIFIMWTYLEKEKIRIIIPLSGLSLRLMGPWSQNIIYHNDDINTFI